MKNKIALKLAVFFSALLVLFAVIIGIIFMMLFSDHTMEVQKKELEKRAVAIADALSEYMSGPYRGNKGSGKAGFGAYIMLLDEIAMADVWIVDEDLELITGGRMMESNISYKDLPQDAEAVVKEVFRGTTTFSEGFGTLINENTLTVGTPVYAGEDVIGALLLHTSVNSINEVISQGLRMLYISISIALVLSVILAVLLAISLTRPLKKMKDSALQLAGGNYSIKTNITQKDEIGELAAAIDNLSERLDFASRESELLQKLRRDFVANVSHELRTPVTVIRGSLEALCDEVVTDPAQVKSYHSQMLNESIALSRLVDDLLDLSRLQNTDFKFEISELNLCSVVEDSVRSAGALAKRRNIEIRTEFGSTVCRVLGDYGRIRQMLLIILHNAVKFSPDGSRVDVILNDKLITIKDKGPGINEKDLPFIFERFYKVKSDKDTDGTGLGLAIAKQIADRHKIAIRVNSSEKAGTEFLIEF